MNSKNWFNYKLFIIDILRFGKGRMHRIDFFMAFTLLGAVQVFLDYFAEINTPITIFYYIFSLIVMYGYFSIYIKRLHDADISGWWVLILIFSYVLMISSSILYFSDVNSGSTHTLDSKSFLYLVLFCVVSIFGFLLFLFFKKPYPYDNKYRPYIEGNFHSKKDFKILFWVVVVCALLGFSMGIIAIYNQNNQVNHEFSFGRMPPFMSEKHGQQ